MDAALPLNIRAPPVVESSDIRREDSIIALNYEVVGKRQVLEINIAVSFNDTS
jgi:hypothetical protein